MDNSLIKLVNPPFDLEFKGEVYQVRKASLDKAVLYQEKVKEMSGQGGQELELVAYCIYLVLKDKIPALSLQEVLENTPADLDVLDTLMKLGFISPTKAQQTKDINEALLKKITSETSSA